MAHDEFNEFDMINKIYIIIYTKYYLEKTFNNIWSSVMNSNFLR